MMLHPRNATPVSASTSAPANAIQRRPLVTGRSLQAGDGALGRLRRAAHRRTLLLQVGEGGVTRALERGGEAGGLRVVVPVGRLVGDVDRVVAGIDLGQFGNEQG